jgi:hypothetical protein
MGIIIKPEGATFTASQLAEMDAKEVEWAATQYQRDRLDNYPSWREQIDMQYHDSVNGTTTWKDTIQAIKDKYPKG